MCISNTGIIKYYYIEITLVSSGPINIDNFGDIYSFHLKRNSEVDVIYTNLMNGFNRLEHRIIRSKLHSLEVRNHLLNWLTSCLTGCTCRVKLQSYV